MSLVIINLLFHLFALTLNFETVFKGKIHYTLNDSSPIPGSKIEFRINNVVVAESPVNANGDFEIKTTVPQKIDIYYNEGQLIPPLYLQSINIPSKDTVLLDYHLPRTYKEKNSKIICPKCNKFNKTIPIKYGFGSSIIIVNKKKLAFNKYPYLDGGCVVSDLAPKFFCKRDKIKF